MKAKVKKPFFDKKVGIKRKAGETFELTEERFAEIEAKIAGYIEKLAEKQPKKAAKKQTPAKEESKATKE